MNKLIHCLLPIGLTMLSACGGPAKPPLAGAAMGGAFALTDENGKRATDRDFAGRYRLVYFGYTSCPDVCPLDVQHLMAGLAAFEKQDDARGRRIAPLFISVDPARDTPEALRVFTDAFHPRLVGLTGTPAEIADVAQRYGIAYQAETPDARGDYKVDHSNQAVLYAPDGAPIAIIASEGPPDRIATELDRWVR